MSLQEELDKARANIKTDAYSMSIGEWINLYTDDELDIHPEFQRFYRWSSSQKSRFVESLLLGIPIPPIFVSQNVSGTWDVVDGLQRLSTLFQLVGVLKDEQGKLSDQLVLEGTQYLPSLAGRLWEHDDPQISLTQAQRLFIKRTKLDVSIILRESDDIAKYELFQRLNTGGSTLSEQEVRNCIIVMLDRDFYAWLRELSQYPAFQETIGVTQRALYEQYDAELALRFIIFRNIPEAALRNIKDLGDFLTSKMVEIIKDPNYDRDSERQIFQQTFDNILNHLGPDAFRRYVRGKDRFQGAFYLSAFETIGMGIGFNDGHIGQDDFAERVKNLWTNDDFTGSSGAGIRGSSRIPKTVPLGRRLFSV